MKNALHKTSAIPAHEWIEQVPNELEVDAIGLWQIIPVGRHEFGLEGADLSEFISLSIIAIVNKGGKPARMISANNEWEIINDYGQSAADISNAIINEWKTDGEPDPTIPDTIWFYRFQD